MTALDPATYHINYQEYTFYDEYKRIQPNIKTTQPQLTKFWSVSLDPKYTSEILKFIKQKFSADDYLKQIKRIKKVMDDSKHFHLEILICPVQQMESHVLTDMLKEWLNTPSDFELTLTTASVPLNKPYSKELCMSWSQLYWPLVWKGNPMVQEIRESYKNFKKGTIEKYLKEACNLSNSSNASHPIATIIVDPIKDQVMASSVDKRSSEDPMIHSVMSCINQVADNERRRRKTLGDHKETNNYLCLNYDVYTTHEPCTMCAMALLHSRIGRLFFIKSSPVTGAIGENSGCKYMIHLSCTLNWKYEAFQYVGDRLHPSKLDSSLSV